MLHALHTCCDWYFIKYVPFRASSISQWSSLSHLITKTDWWSLMIHGQCVNSVRYGACIKSLTSWRGKPLSQLVASTCGASNDSSKLKRCANRRIRVEDRIHQNWIVTKSKSDLWSICRLWGSHFGPYPFGREENILCHENINQKRALLHTWYVDNP